MAASSDEFAALLARARQGDPGAVAELARQYEPEVRLIAHVRLGRALRPYLDTVDLVQSVHRTLALGLREKKFDISSPDKLVALALTLVRRKIARHWRRLQRQQRLSKGPTEPGNLPQLLTALSSPQADPAHEAQFQEAVGRLCSSLDGVERRLMELRLQGYSTAEVARELGEDADVLRVRLSRLRQRLRASGVLTEWL
jgi:RNA polymerase sigma-70 factor (ECF subfamily)